MIEFQQLLAEYLHETRWVSMGLVIGILMLAVQPDPRKILPNRRSRK